MKTTTMTSLNLAILTVLFIGSLGSDASALQKKAAQPTANAISKIKEVTPKSQKQTGKRKKKIQMCQECGKPESKCECEGHN